MRAPIPFPAPRAAPGIRSSAAGVPSSAGDTEAPTRALVAAATDGPTLATVAAGLKVFAEYDIRNAPARPFEPFRCHRCLDLGWVSDWANWKAGWLWQRVEPVPRKACPDCPVGS